MISQTESIIKKIVSMEVRGLERSCPARVTNVERLKEGFINVQPYVNKVNSFDGNNYPYPEIRNVRIIFPSTRRSTFCFPIEKDDEVLLIFQSCNLQKYVSGNKLQHSPIADTYNNLTDVVAYVGFQNSQDNCFNPLNYSNDFSGDDLNIVHNKNTDREVTLKLTEDGDFKIITTGKVILEKVTELDVGNALIKTENDILIKGKSVEQFQKLHNHGGVQSGSSSTLPPNPI